LLFFVDVALKCKLRGYMTELKIGQPDPMPRSPFLSLIAAPVLQQKAANALAGLTNLVRGYSSRLDQILHCFMGRIRRPNIGELAGAMQSGQVECINCIILHTPLSRLNGGSGRRNHLAGMPKPNQVAMQAIATRASLIGKG
tara:strand:- start:230 stop:655 length:426 start_codon:yes stop_codon:yes gene_type:complete